MLPIIRNMVRRIRSVFANIYNILSFLILNGPVVFLQKTVHNFLHRKIGNQLVFLQLNSCDGIEMSDALQMFFDVFALVSDA